MFGWFKRKKAPIIDVVPVVPVPVEEPIKPKGMDMSYEGIASRFLIHSMANATSEEARKNAIEAHQRMIENKPGVK